MTRIQFPSVNSVLQLARERAGAFSEPNAKSKTTVPGKTWTVIANELGTAATAQGLGATVTLFEIELLERVWASNTTYTWRRTGETALCFNDFTIDVPVDQILKVARDATTEYYQIVVWDCN